MTVETTTIQTEPLEGNGSAREFAFPFAVYDEDQLEVMYYDSSGNVDVLAEDVGYSVVLNEPGASGVSVGGVVTYPYSPSDPALPADEFIVIRRRTDRIQGDALSEVVRYNPEGMELMFDKMMMLIQEIEGYGRAQVETFNGDAVTTDFALASIPASLESMMVFVDGAIQTPTTDYSLTNDTISFVSAPATGTANILIFYYLFTPQPEVTADLIKYTPAGATAVTRYLESILQDMFTTPEDHGAVGDGLTDDTTALAAAFALNVPIYMSPGKTYLTSGGLTANASILGNKAVLKLKADSGATNTPIITLAGNSMRVVDLDVDGNMANQTGSGDYVAGNDWIAGCNAIEVTGEDVLVDGVKITDAPYNGIHADGALRFKFINNDIYKARNAGIYTETLATGMVISNSIRYAYLQGIYITDDSVICRGNHIDYSGYGYTLGLAARAAGILLAVDIQYIILSDNMVSNGTGHGIDLGRTDATAVGYHVVVGNTVRSNAYAGIYFSTSGVLISGNMCLVNGSADTADYCSGIALVAEGSVSGLDLKYIQIASNACPQNTRYGIAVIEGGSTYASAISEVEIRDNSLLANGTDAIKVNDGTNAAFSKFRIQHNRGATDLGHKVAADTQSIPNNTLTAVVWSGEDAGDYDPDLEIFNPAFNTLLTAKVKGTYDLEASIEWAAGATGIRTMEILVNGASIGAYTELPALSTYSEITRLHKMGIDLDAGDWVVVQVKQTNGAALSITVGDNSYLKMSYR